MSIWIIVLTIVMQTIYNNNKFKNKQGQTWYQLYYYICTKQKDYNRIIYYIIIMSYTIKAITWDNL